MALKITPSGTFWCYDKATWISCSYIWFWLVNPCEQNIQLDSYNWTLSIPRLAHILVICSYWELIHCYVFCVVFSYIPDIEPLLLCSTAWSIGTEFDSSVCLSRESSRDSWLGLGLVILSLMIGTESCWYVLWAKKCSISLCWPPFSLNGWSNHSIVYMKPWVLCLLF